MITEAEKLKKIIKLDSELNTIQDLDILLERILLEARKAVNADAGSIYIRENNKLEFKYSQNDTKQKDLPPGQKLIYSIFSIDINKKTISGYVAETGELLNIPDVYNIPKGSPFSHDPYYDRVSGYKTESMLTIPLKTNTGNTLGVIQIINAKDSRNKVISFDYDDELFVLHFAAGATVALQRAQITRAILLRMIKMAELRDPKETGEHVNRVAGYSVEIYERWAQKKNRPAQEIERTRDILRMAAMLHDVGKVAISDVLLKKPGRFTPEEFNTMKDHTILGAKLFFDKQSEFDEVAALVALTHHENWEGSGYPGHVDVQTGKPLKTNEKGDAIGKKGEEIPVLGRIVAIADVYDALCSKRSYKKEWKEPAVLKEIRRLSGTKFEPDLVDIFFEVLPSLKQIHERYPDED